MEKIIDVLKADTNFYTFVQMLKSTGIYEKLAGKGPFTIFVPDNDAFGRIPSDELTEIMNHTKLMREVLNYHIIYGKYDSNKLSKEKAVATLLGHDLEIKSNDKIMINKATIIKSDILTSNGIIHIIDRILKPPEILAAV